MVLFEAFWKRQRKLRGETPDVYTYTDLPYALRVQVVQIMIERMGGPEDYFDRFGSSSEVQDAYRVMVETLRRELGVFQLPTGNRSPENLIDELANFILLEPNVEYVLGAIEVVCRLIENTASKFQYRHDQASEANARSSIEELNARFREHGVGYEYAEEIIRIDSELVHVEAVKPALVLLREKGYAGAEQEFRSAYDHYKSGKTKEALTDALKAIESTMKVILTKRRWAHNPTDPAKKLIQACFDNGLIPAYWQSHFTSLQQMLESSVPTARNKEGGHGQGVEIKTIPDYLASYVLHMTASTIVFLVNAEKALP